MQSQEPLTAESARTADSLAAERQAEAEASFGGALLLRIDRAAEWLSGWLQSGQAVTGFILLICLLHFVLRGWIFPGGANDEAEQQLYTQAFSRGYQYSNPPLFTWLVMLVELVMGQGPAALQFVKSLLLGTFFLGFYLVAREVTADRRYALAAALSPFAIYYVAFDAMRNYTHSIALMAATLATLALFFRLRRGGGLTLYLVFGLALGLGLISKYNFGLFAIALLLAGLLDPQAKARILDKRMLISLALALVIIGPNLVWLVEHAPQINAKLVAKLTVDDSAGGLTARLDGLGSLALSLVEISLPLPLLLPLCFPRSCLPRQVSLVEGPDEARALAGQRLLGRFLTILLLMIVIAIALGGFDRISNHYLLIFLSAPLWFFARASRIEPKSGGLHRFFALAMSLAIAASLAIVIKFFTDPIAPGKRAYSNVPYAALAEDLRAAGFREGTIYSYDWLYTVSGHFRRYFPDSRFISQRHDVSPAPPRAEAGQCLIIWYERHPGEAPVIPASDGESFLGIAPDAPYREGFVARPFVNGWGTSFQLSYRLYDESVQRCH